MIKRIKEWKVFSFPIKHPTDSATTMTTTTMRHRKVRHWRVQNPCKVFICGKMMIWRSWKCWEYRRMRKIFSTFFTHGGGKLLEETKIWNVHAFLLKFVRHQITKKMSEMLLLSNTFNKHVLTRDDGILMKNMSKREWGINWKRDFSKYFIKIGRTKHNSWFSWKKNMWNCMMMRIACMKKHKQQILIWKKYWEWRVGDGFKI